MSKSYLILTLVTVIPVLSLFVAALQADPPEHKGKSDKSGLTVDLGFSATVTAGISFGDARQLATNYNLTGSKPLPPGIAKQVLPSGLVTLLPAPPRGFERIEVAGKVLLVEIATQVIHDVLEDIILGK